MSDAPPRAELLRELEARAAIVAHEIADLEVLLRARLSRARPPSQIASGDGGGGGMLSFAAAQARAQADSTDRIEELITSTMDTAAKAQEAERKAADQHARLIAEFGQAAVDAWKTEHEGMAEELIAERDAKLRPLQDFTELVAADESRGRAAVQPRVPVMQSGRAQLLRHVLRDYYRKVAPVAAEERVEDLVARVVGGPPSEVGGALVGGVLWSEAELFAKLEAKYGAKVEVPDLL